MVPAICTQCNASVNVDPSQKAAVCEYCGTAFVVEKAIDEYAAQNITINNIEHTNVEHKNSVTNYKGLFGSLIGVAEKRRDEERQQVAEAKRKEEERLAEAKQNEKERLKQQRLRQDESRKNRRAHFKRHWKVYLGIIVVLFIVGAVHSCITNQNAKPKDVTRSIKITGIDKNSNPLSIPDVKITRTKRSGTTTYAFVTDFKKTSAAQSETYFTFNIILVDKSGKYTNTIDVDTMPGVLSSNTNKLLSAGDTFHFEEDFRFLKDSELTELIFTDITEYTKQDFISQTLANIRKDVDGGFYDSAQASIDFLLKYDPNNTVVKEIAETVEELQEQRKADAQAAAEVKAAADALKAEEDAARRAEEDALRAEAEAAKMLEEALYITVPAASSSLYGENYKNVVTQFETAGFTNIELEEIKDIIFGLLVSDGDVEDVSINGETTFSKSDKFPPDAKVVITYHTYIESKSSSTANSTNSEVPTPTISVTAGELIKEYQDNELRADNRYKGQVIAVTGVVYSVDNELFSSSKYILHIDNGGVWDILTVSCYDIDNDVLAGLESGTKVTVVGSVSSGGSLGVTMKNCYIK